MGSDFKRTLLWVVFLSSLFMLWDSWQVHNGHQSFFGGGAQQSAVASTAAAAPSSAAAASVAASSDPALAAADASSSVQPVEVTTDLMKLTFDEHGASIVRAELLNMKELPDWTEVGLVGLVLGKKEPPHRNVVLFDHSKEHFYEAQTGLIGASGAPNHRTDFKLVDGPLVMAKADKDLSVKFESTSGGVKLVKTFKFEAGRYGMQVTHDVTNQTDKAISPSVYYQIVRDSKAAAGANSFASSYLGAAVYTTEDKFEKIKFSDIADDKKSYPAKTNNGWIAMIQQHFLSAWVPKQGENRELYTRRLAADEYAIGSIVPMGEIAPGAMKSDTATLYVGPQSQSRLAQIAEGLDLVVDYGWLTFLAKPIYWLLSWLYKLVGNWGWAIVLLTVIVKAILYPVSAAGYKSMARMKDLGPRMKEMQAQYGDDKQALNQAMMKMYREEKINPMGGCLPIVLQIPVFLALYWVLLASVELRGSSWILWIKDLAAPDPWFILPLIMMATMLFQIKLNPKPADPTQAKVMWLMPIVFSVMFFIFASGLVLYWLTNNVLSIAQQWYVNKQIDKERSERRAAKAAKAAAKAAKKK
ncbi:MAG: membrane protein insertase YidC [Sutterellaceae bacterium]|nr:membrane protein insertase YidC [Sutterellaceae bacterium]MDD7442590.1 membrane protein insertase YidC [Sutterellaceae bacterium]MDY2867234.1 membrane protein insertase YidC [Mesosutterella sp.]